VLVMLQSSLPTLFFDTGFTDRQPEHLPNWLAAQSPEATATAPPWLHDATAASSTGWL
jgi:hypothetical protein